MTCLGVYRMVGDFNNKPLYKQDEGENYLYYQNKTWLVGPKLNVSHAGASSSGDVSSCFTDYAWMKLDGGKSDGESSSSDESSYSDSDSDSQDEEHREKKMKSKTKRASMELFKQGWQYKSSLMGVELSDSEDPVRWMGDDTTLKVEALRGKFKKIY